MIGIIGALKKETDGIISAMTEKQSEKTAGMEFVRGKLDGKDAVVATCGPGKVFAAVCAEAMILRYSPDIIINSGIAGSLSGALHIGDIAIADKVCQYDMDTSGCGDPVGMVSVVNMIYFPCDAKAVAAAEKTARKMGLNCEKGTIATGDRFVASADEKQRINALFPSVACEMEGGAIGHACYINGVPFFVLRVISDEADGRATENYAEFSTAAAERSVCIIRSMINEMERNEAKK